MKKIWSREESKERFPLPISPLGWSLLMPPTRSTLKALSERMLLRSIAPSDLLQNIDHFVYARKGFFRAGILKKIRPSAWLFFSCKFAWLSLKSGLNRRKFLTSLMNQIFVPEAQRLIQDWKGLQTSLIPRLKKASAGAPDLPVQIDEFISLKDEMEKNSCDFFYYDFSVYFLKNIFSQYLLFAFKDAGYDAASAKENLICLSQGLKENFSVRMALDKSDLSESDWVQKYGYLTDNWDIFAPTLGESKIIPPSFSLQNLLDKHQEQIKRREEKENQFLSLIHFISLFQELLIIDEDMRAFSSLQYPEIRKLFRRVSLTADWPFEDIFFLSVNEIEEGLNLKNFPSLKEQALKRKKEYQIALKKNPTMNCLEENGNFRPLTESSHMLMVGIRISPGQVTAPALVVHQLEDLKKFSHHCILVLRSPNPTYASYYAQCAGIISETGGVLSHGALVAREFQIPMISEVPQALELIKTGDMIYLDASQGKFEVLNKGISG